MHDLEHERAKPQEPPGTNSNISLSCLLSHLSAAHSAGPFLAAHSIPQMSLSTYYVPPGPVLGTRVKARNELDLSLESYEFVGIG